MKTDVGHRLGRYPVHCQRALAVGSSAIIDVEFSADNRLSPICVEQSHFYVDLSRRTDMCVAQCPFELTRATAGELTPRNCAGVKKFKRLGQARFSLAVVCMDDRQPSA